MTKITNAKWESAKPCVTVVTPVYNRSSIVSRTIASVVAQTFRDFEYIIVDDGSTDDLDSVIKPFLESTDIPVMYIKKENGGVHTARNAGVREARGLYLVEIDSDDELTPNALQCFVDTWNSIPEEKRNSYWQVACLCRDQEGAICGKPFPANINELSKEETYKASAATRGEHFDCSLTSIRKQNLFMEPEGVTFYTEVILWALLNKQYRAFFINDVLRIYHTEGEDHLSSLGVTRPKKTLQSCRNGLWECCYALNNWKTYKGWEGDGYLRNLLRYSVFHCILARKGDEMASECKLHGGKNKLLYGIFFLPVWILSWKYERDRM